MVADVSTRAAVNRFCTTISQDRLLVQAAGGNVSWKSGKTLWIKASGTWLADAEHKDIFVPVDLHPIEAALALRNYSINPQVREGYRLRPSIETLLHALMPHKFVIHLHPVQAVANLVRGEARFELLYKLDNVFKWDLVDYHKPGADLAQTVHARLCERPDLQVVLLENHGVLIGAETIGEIDQHLQSLCQRLSSPARPLNTDTKDNVALAAVTLEGSNYRVCHDDYLHCLATDPDLFERLSDSWAICPDHVVFLGANALRIEEPEALNSMLGVLVPSPPFIFIKGVGVLEKKDISQAQKAQLTFYLDVMARQVVGKQLTPLSNTQIASLLDWEAEKYRQSLNNQSPLT